MSWGEICYRYLFNSRYLFASALNRQGLLGNRYVLLAIGVLVIMQRLFTYAPLAQQGFGTAALDGSAWWRITMFGMAIFALVEIEKALQRQWRR